MIHTFRPCFQLIFISLFFIWGEFTLKAQEPLSAANLLSLKSASIVQLHPDGNHLIYKEYTPRTPNEAPGASHVSYLLLDLKTKQSSPVFHDPKDMTAPQWSPDGKYIAFLKRVNKHRQIFVKPFSGGEALQVSHAPNGVNQYQWNPTGKGFAYISTEAYTEKELELKRRGYHFIHFEENIKNDHLFVLELAEDFSTKNLYQVNQEGMVWDFQFDKKGEFIAYSGTSHKLIDERYMFRKIHLFDLKQQSLKLVLNNTGKLGNYAFSPDNKQLCYTGAYNINDHGVSQLYLVNLNDGSISNHTPDKLQGHITWANWVSKDEIIYVAHMGVYPQLVTYNINTKRRAVKLDAKNSQVIFSEPYSSNGYKNLVFTGNTAHDISNLYTWDKKEGCQILTDINPELKHKALGQQEIIRYQARDGLAIEGVLIKPNNYQEGEKYPLILYVHGGPESHHSNGWLSYYSTPGQVMAGKGYLVAYINYRASTGYGVEFAMQGFEDPAGKEFDDLADAIDYLVKEKGADRERVGMAGGSYGGYASAWFATYYTQYIKAAAVFVGITNIISKKGTTDIPYEEVLVHSNSLLEEQWEMNLKRSPIYHAHKSKTATLIYGGAADTRIHPAQSMELYRRMKMNNHPAVRLVQYPEEGHGNRKQVGRIDVIYRQMAWMDWYVRDLKPLNGPMPPLDISDQYGLDW